MGEENNETTDVMNALYPVQEQTRLSLTYLYSAWEKTRSHINARGIFMVDVVVIIQIPTTQVPMDLLAP